MLKNLNINKSKWASKLLEHTLVLLSRSNSNSVIHVWNTENTAICLYPVIRDAELKTIESKALFLLKKNILITRLNFILYFYIFTISSIKELLHELQNKMLQLKTFKKDLLNTLHKFLEEHFPLPKKDGIAANMVRFSQ